MMNLNTPVNRVASISNLDLVAVAAEKLLHRVDGLPGIGVMYGEPGRGKTIACVALANQTRGYYVQMRSAWSRKALLEKILFEMGIKPAGTITQPPTCLGSNSPACGSFYLRSDRKKNQGERQDRLHLPGLVDQGRIPARFGYDGNGHWCKKIVDADSRQRSGGAAFDTRWPAYRPRTRHRGDVAHDAHYSRVQQR